MFGSRGLDELAASRTPGALLWAEVRKKACCLLYPVCGIKSSRRFEIEKICNAECMYVVYGIHLYGM